MLVDGYSSVKRMELLFVQSIYVCTVMLAPIYFGNPYIYNLDSIIFAAIVYGCSIVGCMLINRSAVNISNGKLSRIIISVSIFSIMIGIFYLISFSSMDSLYAGKLLSDFPVVHDGHITLAGFGLVLVLSLIYGLASLPAWIIAVLDGSSVHRKGELPSKLS